MEYVFAALLLHKLNKDITEDNVVNVIKATGVTPDEVKVKALVAALSEVNIEEALKAAPIAAPQPSSPASGKRKPPPLDQDARGCRPRPKAFRRRSPPARASPDRWRGRTRRTSAPSSDRR